ncbi:MAG TPA: AsmA family protein, partial [Longimicrobiales bacterium]
MKRRRRLLLFFLLFLPLVLAGGLAAAVLLLPTERIAALASERAEAVLEREVNIGRISIDLFPTPAVALEGVVVGGATPDAPPFATVRRVVLRPRLLPLFARKVVIDAVVLDHPRMLINVSSSAALDRRVSEEVAAPAEAGGSAAFLIRRFEIQDGRIAYRDRKTGNVVRL